MCNVDPGVLSVFLSVTLFAGPVAAAPPDCSWLPPAPRLPPPSGQVIRVATVEQLFEAARNVRPGGTILVADGHYMMPRYFELSTDGVTLRGASGDRGQGAFSTEPKAGTANWSACGRARA